MREGGNQKKDENEQAMPVFVKMLAKPLKRLEAVFSEVICNYHSQQLYLSRLVDYVQPEIEVLKKMNADQQFFSASLH